MTLRRRRSPFIFLILLPAGFSAWACSVPVFRYALEHWAADPYEATVFHRGPPGAQETALLRKFSDKHEDDAAQPNIVVHDVNLAQSPPPEAIEAWKQAGSPDAPWIMIRSPRSQPQAGMVFSAPLNDATVSAVLDSPARREIIRRIGEGESAVWILLESGDKARDDAAAKIVGERLAYLGGVMELPKLDEQDIKNGLVSVPPEGLRLAFSMLRVSRDDTAEKFFVQTLLASEPDLRDHKEPMAFPVFGQARVLYALIGAGIRHENIDKAATFLTGSCSCQVKEQNPGTDLLVAASWKKLLKDQALGAQDLPKASDIIGDMPQTVTISPKTPEQTAPEHGCAAMSWVRAHPALAASGAVLASLLLGLAFVRIARRK